jgi:Domain of unknown function (DUF4276)
VKRVLVLVEGQTEETFFNGVVCPHLTDLGIDARCTLICTQREEGRRKFRGGHGNRWRHVERDIRLLLGSKPDLVSTMIDVYKFPRDMPNFPSPWPSTTQHRVSALCAAFSTAICDRRFVPGLMVHEFEGLLFADVDRIVDVVSMDLKRIAETKRALQAVRDQFRTPEDIDDGVETAPSKRILDVLGAYAKVSHGPRIAKAIGLSRLRQACPHFSAWLDQLEKLG